MPLKCRRGHYDVERDDDEPELTPKRGASWQDARRSKSFNSARCEPFFIVVFLPKISSIRLGSGETAVVRG